MPIRAQLSGPSGSPPQTTTDQDGRFAFDRVAPGEYRVDVQKAGYAPLSIPFGEPPRTIRVAAGQAAAVELHLQKGAAISGRVIDAMGEPVADVRVMAMRRLPERSAPDAPRWIPAGFAGQQTNDLGEFRVSGLAAGEYVIAAMPQGSMSAFGAPGVPLATARPSRPSTTTTTTYYPGTADQAAAQPIVAAAGSEIGNIVFTMQSAAAYRVSGVVVDENGTPVAGAWVMLMGDPRSGVFIGRDAARTEVDGRFTIDGVVSGTYRATASIPIATGGIPVTGGVVGGVSGGVVGGVSGGVVGGGGSVVEWSVGGPGMPAPAQPTEVVVTDANVTGVRVVVRRPS